MPGIICASPCLDDESWGLPLNVGVVGLGYVGAVTGACLARLGRRVIGVDQDRVKADAIAGGRSPIAEPGLDDLLAEGVAASRIRVGEIGEAVAASDVIMVAVGTPSTAAGGLDLTALMRVAEQIGAAMPRDGRFRTVAIRSTVLPGTIDNEVRPSLERASGMRAAVDFGIAMNPEFLREGSSIRDFDDASRTIIGADDERSAAQVSAVYEGTASPIQVVPIRTAEMIKYTDNAFHAVKITFANEIAAFARAHGVDGREVMRLMASDHRLNISPAYLKPGYAFGGSCLPKDLRAVTERARKVDLQLPLLEAALTSNSAHFERGFRLVDDGTTRGVAVLGLSFKASTDDLRESPAVALAERLLGRGHRLAIYDPDVHPELLRGANRVFIEERLPHLGAVPRRPSPRQSRALTRSSLRSPGRSWRSFRGWWLPGSASWTSWACRCLNPSDRSVMSESAGSRPARVTGRRALILVEDLPVPFDRRVWSEAQTLRDAGWRVSVVCPRGENARRWHERIDEIEVFRYPLPTTSAGLLHHVAEYAIAIPATLVLSILAWRGRRVDVVHACNPPDFLFLVAGIFRGLGSAFVYDQHDLAPEVYVAQGGRRGGLVHRFLLWCEGRTYRMADAVISTNESYRRVAISRGGLDPDRLFIVRSSPDPARIHPVGPDPKLKRGRPFLVAYLGTMGPQDGVDLFVDSARRVLERRRGSVRFVAMGSGNQLEVLRRRAALAGLGEDDLVFTGRVPDEEVRRTLSTADVAVSPDPENDFNEYCTMNKTLEYMASGVPVVAFDLEETRISAAEAAAYATPNDPDEMAELILTLLDDPRRRATMGRIGRERITGPLSWSVSAAALIAAYEEAVSRRRAA